MATGMFCGFALSIGTSARAPSLGAWVLGGKMGGIACAREGHNIKHGRTGKQTALAAGSVASPWGGPWIIVI